MNHAQLIAAVKKLAGDMALDYGESDGLHSSKGWVDLVIFGRGGLLFAECKAEDGRRTQDQIRCGTRLASAGHTYRLWRPSDLDSGLVREELEKIA